MRLSTFLREHFSADYIEDVSVDSWNSLIDACKRVIGNPAKFPNAEPGFHAKAYDELMAAGGYR